MVCKWPCLSEMQRLLCTLSRCVGALHFFGLRCLLSNAGSAAVIIHAGVGWCDPFCSRLCTPTPTHTGHRNLECDSTTDFFHSSPLQVEPRCGFFHSGHGCPPSQLLATHFHHGRTDHGQVQVASILSSNTTTCYNTKLTLNCLVLWLDLLACQTL